MMTLWCLKYINTADKQHMQLVGLGEDTARERRYLIEIEVSVSRLLSTW